MSQFDHESPDQSAAANALVRKFKDAPRLPSTRWRVGTRVPINIYAGDRPICQCHTALDAKLIVKAVNAFYDREEA